MAGVRKSNKKKSAEEEGTVKEILTSRLVCKPLSERTRRIEWNKWMKFSAGIFLMNAEVRQLTEAGCEI